MSIGDGDGSQRVCSVPRKIAMVGFLGSSKWKERQENKRRI
jgi:hypothetical protein